MMSTTTGRRTATPLDERAGRSDGLPDGPAPALAVPAWGWPVLLLLLGTASPATGQAAPDSQAAEVEAVAERVLQGISDGNPALLEEALHPQAYLMAVPDQGVARKQERAEFIRTVGDSGGRFLERMWEPHTEISGPVAMVWAPYDFHIDGQFSHCGIDAFQLIRQDDRWEVLSVVYTMRRGDDCEPSPLGPPGL